ncbi:MAG TPA: adenosine deaminase [Chloroflexota bacterium]|jgi:adenosine deaminase|nr:adenosine deaminase [Chloroflexota bacterium]
MESTEPHLDVARPSAGLYGRRPGPNLAELHVHVGAAIEPHILYSMAHAQGIRLPVSGYWHFVDLVTADPDRVKTHEGYLALFHWTELIQSSPSVMQACVQSVIGGGFRHANVDLVELRFCPAKRNRGRELDLDHIILAAVHGMQRALLEYPEVTAGLILSADRTLLPEVNAAIVRKAIRYRDMGIVGVDLAGPDAAAWGGVRALERPFAQAREAGLGITCHTGEIRGSEDEIDEVLRRIRPDRIGHGIRAAWRPDLLERLQRDGVVLELCPTSNLRTRALAGVEELRFVVERLEEFGVPYTLNTDGPEFLVTDLPTERALLRDNGILDDGGLTRTDALARRATFIPGTRPAQPPAGYPAPGTRPAPERVLARR